MLDIQPGLAEFPDAGKVKDHPKGQSHASTAVHAVLLRSCQLESSPCTQVYRTANLPSHQCHSVEAQVHGFNPVFDPNAAHTRKAGRSAGNGIGATIHGVMQAMPVSPCQSPCQLR